MGILQLFGQRLQMALRQAALLVLDEVQILDQQRALARALAKQRLDRRHLVLLSTRPRGKRRRLAPARAWMDGATARPRAPSPWNCHSCVGSLRSSDQTEFGQPALRRANTGALAYHMPYARFDCRAWTRRTRNCVLARRTRRCSFLPTSACSCRYPRRVRRPRLTCTVTIAVGLDLYTKTRRAKADDRGLGEDERCWLRLRCGAISSRTILKACSA